MTSISTPPPRPLQTLPPQQSSVMAHGGTSKAGPSTTPRRVPSPLPSKKTEATSAEAYATANGNGTTNGRRDKTTKPLFGWFTRKLGGNRRATISDASSSPIHDHQRYGSNSKQPNPTQIFAPTTYTRENSFITRSESHSLRSYSYPTSERRREANNPYPFIPIPQPRGTTIDSESRAPSTNFVSRSRTSSLRSERSNSSSLMRVRRSTWDDSSSYRVFGRFADEDASVRPIPPSHPTSPEPSSGSTSLLAPPFQPRYSTSSSSPGEASITSSSDHEPGTSMISTKPTTVLSFDSGPHVAHIAQVPQSMPSSPLRPAGISAARAVVIANNTEDVEIPPTPVTSSILTESPIAPEINHSPTLFKAPKHSHPHPRDNPQPSAPPDANASMLTLASSTFALGTNQSITGGSSVGGHAWSQPSINRLRDVPRNPPTSVIWAPTVSAGSPSDRPSSSHAPASLRTNWAYGGGSLQPLDDDASVRGLRGRRDSWESVASRWSWRGNKVVGDNQRGNSVSGIIGGRPQSEKGIPAIEEAMLRSPVQSVEGEETGHGHGESEESELV